jgi:hypothetical protein
MTMATQEFSDERYRGHEHLWSGADRGKVAPPNRLIYPRIGGWSFRSSSPTAEPACAARKATRPSSVQGSNIAS